MRCNYHLTLIHSFIHADVFHSRFFSQTHTHSLSFFSIFFNEWFTNGKKRFCYPVASRRVLRCSILNKCEIYSFPGQKINGPEKRNCFDLFLFVFFCERKTKLLYNYMHVSHVMLFFFPH